MSKMSYWFGGNGGFSAARLHTFTCIIQWKSIVFQPDEAHLKEGHICVFHGTSSATPLGRQFKISQEISYFSLSYRILHVPMNFAVSPQPLTDSLFQLNNLTCPSLLTLNPLYQTDVMILYISYAE